nr:NERD domain-containing protein [Fortiea sp. LEGE XX443]
MIACLTGAFILYKQGQNLWSLANRADQGASGEENVAQLLKVLERLVWKIEYNIRLQHWGDADVFLLSPHGNCFVVDIKTNKGGVFFDGSVLKQRYGKKIHDFANRKVLLRAVKGQAAAVKNLKQLSYVQPIICFTQANLDEITQQQKIKGVYVVSTANLVNLLQQLDRN